MIVARVKLDFRRLLRRLGNEALDAIVERLLAGRQVSGAPVAPLEARQRGARTIRRRVLGVRVTFAADRGRPGIRTGSMLRAIARRSNVRVGRTSFKIRPPEEVWLRWFVFNFGSSRNRTPRTVSGMTAEQVSAGGAAVAAEGRVQIVRALNRR
jgi:hypothetical protein